MLINRFLITWAWKRAEQKPADLVCRFLKLEAWEAGEIQPVLKQAKTFTVTPVLVGGRSVVNHRIGIATMWIEFRLQYRDQSVGVAESVRAV